jgi:hypothetical protein
LGTVLTGKRARIFEETQSLCHLRANAGEAVSTWWPTRIVKKLATRIGKTKARSWTSDDIDNNTIDPCRFYDAVDDAKVLEARFDPTSDQKTTADD